MIKTVYQQIIGFLFQIRTAWPIWFYILNAKPRRLFSAHKPSLDSVQKRIVSELDEKGIAVTSLDELFPNENKLSELLAFIHKSETAGTPKVHRKKTYLLEFWPRDITLDLRNPFLQLSLNKKVLDIINSYMQMWCHLKYYYLAKTVLKNISCKRQYSQQWHRDPQEKRYCKIFVYLNDVDEETGPFTYIPYSTYGKKYEDLFPQNPPEGSYPDKEELEKQISSTEWLTLTGKAGTVIFADTTGLHRGGFSKTKERIMFIGFYTAPSYKEPKWFLYPENVKEAVYDHLSPEAVYALDDSK